MDASELSMTAGRTLIVVRLLGKLEAGLNIIDLV